MSRFSASGHRPVAHNGQVGVLLWEGQCYRMSYSMLHHCNLSVRLDQGRGGYSVKEPKQTALRGLRNKDEERRQEKMSSKLRYIS